MKRPKLLRRVIVAAAALAVTGVVSVPSGPAAAGVEEEAAVAAFVAAAEELGVIGLHRDDGDGSYTLRIPQDADRRKYERLVSGALLGKSHTPSARVLLSRFTVQRHDALRKVLRERSWEDPAHRYIYGFHYDAEVDAVTVATTAPRPITDEIRRLHGNDVDVVSGPGMGRTKTDRYADEPPHYGGSAITDGFILCSSGLNVLVDGRVYGMTANHCAFDSFYKTFNTAVALYGHVYEAPPYPTYEFTLLTGSTYASRIWRTRDASRKVRYASNPVVGNSYCFSGQQSGEKCGQKLVLADGEVCDDDGCTYPVSVYKPSVTSALLQGGDSGAPFYSLYSTGEAQVKGLGFGSLDGYNYAEKWSEIATYYGATIYTG